MEKRTFRHNFFPSNCLTTKKGVSALWNVCFFSSFFSLKKPFFAVICHAHTKFQFFCLNMWPALMFIFLLYNFLLKNHLVAHCFTFQAESSHSIFHWVLRHPNVPCSSFCCSLICLLYFFPFIRMLFYLLTGFQLSEITHARIPHNGTGNNILEFHQKPQEYGTKKKSLPKTV